MGACSRHRRHLQQILPVRHRHPQQIPPAPHHHLQQILLVRHRLVRLRRVQAPSSSIKALRSCLKAQRRPSSPLTGALKSFALPS